jgi:hypothetical protein
MEYTVAPCCWEFCHRLFSFGQSHHLKSCTGPHIIAMHPNQYNFTYKDSYHIVSWSMVMTSTFITIIPWLFHSPITCRLVCNTNSYISMHYHHVIAYNHNFNLVSTYQQFYHQVFKLEIDLIISHNSINVTHS